MLPRDQAQRAALTVSQHFDPLKSQDVVIVTLGCSTRHNRHDRYRHLLSLLDCAPDSISGNHCLCGGRKRMFGTRIERAPRTYLAVAFIIAKAAAMAKDMKSAGVAFFRRARGLGVGRRIIQKDARLVGCAPVLETFKLQIGAAKVLLDSRNADRLRSVPVRRVAVRCGLATSFLLCF